MRGDNIKFISLCTCNAEKPVAESHGRPSAGRTTAAALRNRACSRRAATWRPSGLVGPCGQRLRAGARSEVRTMAQRQGARRRGRTTAGIFQGDVRGLQREPGRVVQEGRSRAPTPCLQRRPDARAGGRHLGRLHGRPSRRSWRSRRRSAAPSTSCAGRAGRPITTRGSGRSTPRWSPSTRRSCSAPPGGRAARPRRRSRPRAVPFCARPPVGGQRAACGHFRFQSPRPTEHSLHKYIFLNIHTHTHTHTPASSVRAGQRPATRSQTTARDARWCIDCRTTGSTHINNTL